MFRNMPQKKWGNEGRNAQFLASLPKTLSFFYRGKTTNLQRNTSLTPTSNTIHQQTRGWLNHDTEKRAQANRRAIRHLRIMNPLSKANLPKVVQNACEEEAEEETDICVDFITSPKNCPKSVHPPVAALETVDFRNNCKTPLFDPNTLGTTFCA